MFQRNSHVLKFPLSQSKRFIGYQRSLKNTLSKNLLHSALLRLQHHLLLKHQSRQYLDMRFVPSAGNGTCTKTFEGVSLWYKHGKAHHLNISFQIVITQCNMLSVRNKPVSTSNITGVSMIDLTLLNAILLMTKSFCLSQMVNIATVSCMWGSASAARSSRLLSSANKLRGGSKVKHLKRRASGRSIGVAWFACSTELMRPRLSRVSETHDHCIPLLLKPLRFPAVVLHFPSQCPNHVTGASVLTWLGSSLQSIVVAAA